jgi:hypothetical protein
MRGLHRSTPAELKERLEAERRGTPFLLWFDGDGRQRIAELRAEQARLTIGRQLASDVALDWDSEVSRAHAEIERIGDVWTLVDDGRSRNGSYVGDERVHGRRPLRHGDVVRIGRTALTFVAGTASHGGSTAVAGGEPPPAITPAQRRVLVALCRPFADGGPVAPPSNRELAEELCVSVETVKVHLHALVETFGLVALPQHRKRATLVRVALERGVVAPHELLG